MNIIDAFWYIGGIEEQCCDRSNAFDLEELNPCSLAQTLQDEMLKNSTCVYMICMVEHLSIYYDRKDEQFPIKLVQRGKYYVLLKLKHILFSFVGLL